MQIFSLTETFNQEDEIEVFYLHWHWNVLEMFLNFCYAPNPQNTENRVKRANMFVWKSRNISNTIFTKKRQKPKPSFFFSLLWLHSSLLCQTPVGAHLIGKVTAGLVVRYDLEVREQASLQSSFYNMLASKKGFFRCKVRLFSVSWHCSIVCLWSARAIFAPCFRGLNIFFLNL